MQALALLYFAMLDLVCSNAKYKLSISPITVSVRYRTKWSTSNVEQLSKANALNNSAFELKEIIMKTKLALSLVLIGSLLAPAAGYTSDYTGGTSPSSSTSPKEVIKDSVITSKIKAKMATDKQVSAMRIKVETDKSGVVQLSGTAKSQAEVDRAVAIAREVEGVTSVENNIQIK